MTCVIVSVIFTSSCFTYAQEHELQIDSVQNESITIPIFDSYEELKKAEEEELITTYQVYLQDNSGGTQYCKIKPVLIRTIGGCELYFDFDSTFQLSAVRFKELIIESEYIGKNFFKKSSQKYIVKDLDFSLYTGKRLIYRGISIPKTENRVTIRTKGLGIYRNSPAGWLSCQYQIGGWWKIA